MTDQHQTEAQRLAALLRSRNNNPDGFGLGPICDKAADELLRLNSAHVALERVSMQLAACGVVAMADTPDSAKKARIMHPDYESASCDDVKRRVDECIALRARVAELEDVLTNLPLSSPQRMRARIQRLEEMLAAVGAGGVGPLMPPVAERPGVLMPSRSLVDQVIRELARYCNTGEMDDAESLLAGLQLSIDPAQQPPTTEQSSAVDQPEPAYLRRDLAADASDPNPAGGRRMTDQPVTTEHLAELYAAANKANSDLSKARCVKPRDPDAIERARQRSSALNSAYDAARRRYKKQQKAASRAELRNTMIRLCLDAAAASS